VYPHFIGRLDPDPEDVERSETKEKTQLKGIPVPPCLINKKYPKQERYTWYNNV
jgi:hypothetical protein